MTIAVVRGFVEQVEEAVGIPTRRWDAPALAEKEDAAPDNGPQNLRDDD